MVYDLEWIPGEMKLRMVGVFDGERYRCYSSVGKFVEHELTHKNSGRWFYAHAGGLADLQFVIPVLQARGYTIHGALSGSSVIIARVSRAGRNWYFVDSFWLIRDSLRNIGKWVGIAKGNDDESVEFYRTASFLELRDYNELDCLILYKGIQLFEDALYELGGQLRMTQASCAMDLFRRRFLSREIRTSPAINVKAREAYFASRVEVLATRCENAYYYDVNSSFPYAMTFPQPGEFLKQFHGPPTGSPEIWMGDATVEMPDGFLPPLPVRAGRRLFFPTGRWRGWYSNVDLELLESCGGTIHQVHESLSFQPMLDLREYSLSLYELRKKSDGALKVVCKYLMNSLYGKFAESELKTELVINPDEPQPGWTMLAPGVFNFDKVAKVPHMHVPIAVHVTAIGRRTLYNYMRPSVPEIHYCDTDGFSTMRTYPDGNELGDLKLEKYIRQGRFMQAKVYHISGTDTSGKPAEIVRAKGFSRMTLEKFEKLLNFEEIEFTRMARIRENARRGDFTPREYPMSKGIHRDAISKRSFYADGKSRPWGFDELNRLLLSRGQDGLQAA